MQLEVGRGRGLGFTERRWTTICKRSSNFEIKIVSDLKKKKEIVSQFGLA